MCNYTQSQVLKNSLSPAEQKVLKAAYDYAKALKVLHTDMSDDARNIYHITMGTLALTAAGLMDEL